VPENPEPLQAEEPPESRSRKSSFGADLRDVLAEREFRKLFAIRLVSQGGGGIFNAGFTAYAFFSATTFPDPPAAVEAFAVLYLPYSLIGPFVGVFIDRWSRRQIIAWASMIQAAMVAVASFIVLSGQTRLPFYISVLAILGAGRFFLSALSAATPHVVRADKLVMANSVAPTCGTIVGFLGGLAGLSMRLTLGGSNLGSAATLLVSAVFYVVAGLLGLRMSRGLLGPSTAPGGQAARASIAAELAGIARGLWAALRHLGQRRKAAYALGAVSVHHALYGILLVQGLLLYRNYFYPGGNGDAALRHATGLVATSAIGFGLAAVLTPLGTKRLSMDTWITAWLAIGAVTTALLGPTFSQVPFLVMGFIMGLSAQCVKICTDTTLQQQVDDAYMGRAFSLYDMLYNVTYVVGPAIAMPFLPATGKSYPVVLTIGACYLAGAATYAALALRRTPGAEAPGSPPSQPSPIVQ
jgi:Major Facilitator Superfamily